MIKRFLGMLAAVVLLAGVASAQDPQAVIVWDTSPTLTANTVFGPFTARSSCVYFYHEITSFTGTSPTWRVDIKIDPQQGTNGNLRTMTAQTTTSGSHPGIWCKETPSSIAGELKQLVILPRFFYLRLVLGGTSPVLTSKFSLVYGAR